MIPSAVLDACVLYPKMSNTRRRASSLPKPLLDLRTFVVLITAIAVGVVVGRQDGPATGIGTGVTVAAVLHALLA